MNSIFATSPPNQTPPVETPPVETPPVETPPVETPPNTETPPEEAVVRMPDGTEVPAKEYVATQVQEETRKLNSEWDRARAAAVREAGGDAPESESATPTKNPAWRVEVDDDTFQSDVEKTLANGHNALGDEVSKLNEGIESIQKQLGTLEESTTVEQTQRQIEEIERTQGVTEDELKIVYNEFGGEVKSLPALAEVAAARKNTTQESEARTKTANQERVASVSKVSGGGNAAPNGSASDEKGRGLTGKQRYNGAAIAKKYSAFD